MIKSISLFLLFCINFSSLFAEGYIKANEGIEWDSQNQTYTALGSVEFSNDSFLAFSDKMIAQYVTENKEEIFTIIELFDNVVVSYKEETFKGDYSIYTKKNNTIYLKGNVVIKSPTRILTGDELIVDLDSNKRTLNSNDNKSLVEVLLENDSNN